MSTPTRSLNINQMQQPNQSPSINQQFTNMLSSNPMLSSEAKDAVSQNINANVNMASGDMKRYQQPGVSSAAPPTYYQNNHLSQQQQQQQQQQYYHHHMTAIAPPSLITHLEIDRDSGNETSSLSPCSSSPSSSAAQSRSNSFSVSNLLRNNITNHNNTAEKEKENSVKEYRQNADYSAMIKC
ncbi:unnamed protein product, partial [Anisakis simplex]|uniref:Uncharacterized protein n=1 Tax=Anisakis simplex TaxID=6269 RepID=A0A0M3JNN5_ANISI